MGQMSNQEAQLGEEGRRNSTEKRIPFLKGGVISDTVES